MQHAVLALLAERPSYGYELKANFQRSVGPQWGELNIGHVYQVLERLVRDGLASKRAVEQDRRPDKMVYRLTKSGREELERWLETPFVRQSGYRDDFFLKLFAAARLGPSWLGKVLEVQREAYVAELASLAELRGDRDDPLVDLLIEAATLHTEANLRVVEQADERRSALARAAAAEAARAQATPARTQPARRRASSR